MTNNLCIVASIFFRNKRLLKTLIKMQGIIRGIQFRKKQKDDVKTTPEVTTTQINMIIV